MLKPLLLRQPLFYIEWISTLTLIIGVYLTAINYYPLNVYISLLGNVGWLIVASAWRKYSLITVQLIIVIVYIVGFYYK